jgi:hypothetical protein
MKDRTRTDQLHRNAMRRYFFHLKRGQVTILDKEGTETAGIEEAAKEAARRGREIAKRSYAYGGVPSGAVIVIADEQWRPMLEVPIKDGDA